MLVAGGLFLVGPNIGKATQFLSVYLFSLIPLSNVAPQLDFDKANVVADGLSKLPKQGDIVEDVEAVLPLVPVDTTIFPVQLQEVQELQEQDRSLRKKVRDIPKEFSKQTIEQIKVQ